MKILPSGVALLLLSTAPGVSAELYSFTNDAGQYVISKKPPTDKNVEYAVLSDDGEFIRTVKGRQQQVPISHWRPWYLPKEPHPFDAQPGVGEDREPIVTVDEGG